MAFDRKKERQTHIMDDAAAISLAQQRQSKRKKKAIANPSTSEAASNAKSNDTAIMITRTRFYEVGGVKIPLYEKNGKRKIHARLSTSLRNNNVAQLLEIVQEYAGATKKQEFENANPSKATIADWIELVETRALGAHPKSKLTFEDDMQMEVEDALRSPKPERKDAKGKGPAKLQGKRKLDNASEPPEQTAKKLKTASADEQPTKSPDEPPIKLPNEQSAKPPDEQLAKQSLAEPEPLKKKKKKKKKPKAEIPKITEMSDESTSETNKPSSTDNDVHDFMREMDIHPDNPDTSTRTVHLPEEGEDRVFTATTNPHTGGVLVHGTSIPHNYNALDSSQAVEAAKPFLKPGRHGRHGDFENDPDRATGRGHQINPQDLQAHGKYVTLRGQVLKQYPSFPKARDGEEVESEVKKAWEENERTHAEFRNKYPGFAVAHLWPCGCEVVREEDESEEE